MHIIYKKIKNDLSQIINYISGRIHVTRSLFHCQCPDLRTVAYTKPMLQWNFCYATGTFSTLSVVLKINGVLGHQNHF